MSEQGECESSSNLSVSWDEWKYSSPFLSVLQKLPFLGNSLIHHKQISFSSRHMSFMKNAITLLCYCIFHIYSYIYKRKISLITIYKSKQVRSKLQQDHPPRDVPKNKHIHFKLPVSPHGALWRSTLTKGNHLWRAMLKVTSSTLQFGEDAGDLDSICLNKFASSGK